MKLLLNELDILVINMDSCIDRRKHMDNVLDGLGIPTYIDAIDGKHIGNDNLNRIIVDQTEMDWYSPYGHKSITSKLIARKGCYLSHLKTLHYASIHNLKNILILEDDVYFDRSINTIEIPDDFDIFYLGGFIKTKTIDRFIPLQTGINHIDSTLAKYWTAHAYIVSDPTKLLLNFYKHRPTTYDAFLINYIQKKNRCYYMYPPLIKQSPLIPSTIDTKCPYRHSAF
tara:strand:+ start:244 stop:924 length:681 start_codon:yes stop_codon:yes gene_type:complete